MFKYIIILLCTVYGILAETSFIENGKRAEIFELTDNEVPVFRINLPQEEFETLKEYAVVEGLEKPISKLSDTLDAYYNRAKEKLEYILQINFNEEYPGIDLSKNLSELKIGPDGYSTLDINEVLSAYDRDVKHYIGFNFMYDNIYIYFTANNKYLDLIMIERRLDYLKTRVKKVSDEKQVKPMEESKSSAALSKIINASNTYSNNNLNLNETTESYKFVEEAKFPSILEIENNLKKRDRYDDLKDYKTKNATMIVELAGKEHEFNNVTFSLSGKYTRYLSKPNFNIKIRDDQDLYGRSQFKLRSDYTEPTFLRSKLTSDIYDRLGLLTISANYATLYINDEYFGLFVLTDAIKLSWIKYVFNEERTKQLFKCADGATISRDAHQRCLNANEKDHLDYTKWYELVDKLDFAIDMDDLKNTFDEHQLLYSMAVEYLLGAWDNYRNGNNFYVYLSKDGLWEYLSYDFDHNFGINLDRVFIGHIYEDLPESLEMYNRNYPEYSIDKWFYDEPVYNYIVLGDRTRFYDIIKDIVKKVFNPATLFARIDEIKDFIRPYVEKEYTPDENGHYPGRINTLATTDYTFAEWEANSEFTSVETVQFFAYGIKYWILARYRYICKKLDVECDPTYTSEDYQYPIDESVEFKSYFKNYEDNKIRCKAQLVGYSCCPYNVREVVYKDENGDWGYDYEQGEWCGLTPYEEVCWSEKINYPCCSGCEVIYTDNDGKWGVENNNWCGIPSSCKN